MHSQLEAIFDDAESRYLKSDELHLLSQYVESLPIRLNAYRNLRDRELEIMQPVADQLQTQLPNEKIENLERALKTAMLTLRYCAMGLLLNDQSFAQDRLISWLGGTMRLYNIQSINTVLHPLVQQHLSQVLSPQEMDLLAPYLTLAETLIREQSLEMIGTQ
ncbi:hypothetical protein AB3R30_03245 [Leptolyngbyaceae cyanobacterium UHCC 1019]